MNILQNAWAYVSRKSLKPSLFSLFYLVWQRWLLVALAVKHATDTAAKETFKSINSSFSMQIDRRHNQRDCSWGGNLKGKRYSSD